MDYVTKELLKKAIKRLPFEIQRNKIQWRLQKKSYIEKEKNVCEGGYNLVM